MTMYTYVGNKDPGDGTTQLKLNSGTIARGGWGDFTDEEFAYFDAHFYLVPAGSEQATDEELADAIAALKLAPRVTEGDVDPTGAADAIAGIGAVLADVNMAVVPAGTYRVDSVLTVGEYRVLACEPGVTFIRQTAHSADTDSVARLRGTVDGGRLIAPWGGVTLKTENAHPRGVLDYGPANLAVAENLGRCRAQGLIIRGRGPGVATDIGIRFDSSQAAVARGGANAGSSYNHLAYDCRVHDVGTGVQWAELANANRVRDIYMSNIGWVAYDVEGGPDVAHSTAEVGASGGFIDQSTDRAITIIKCRWAYFPQFQGILAEPDAPGGNASVPYDIGPNCKNVSIDGYFNMTGAGIDSGTDSFIRDKSTMIVPELKYKAVAARLWKSANQNLAHNTQVAIFYDVEDGTHGTHDDHGMHDNVTNRSRLTCIRAGKYQVEGRVAISTSVAGNLRQALLMLNAATVLDVDRRNPNTGGFDTVLKVSATINMALGDYVEMYVQQDSGLTLAAVSNDAWSPTLQATYLGS